MRVSTTRSAYVTVFVTPGLRRRLEQDAAENGVSISRMAHKYLADAMGLPAVPLERGALVFDSEGRVTLPPRGRNRAPRRKLKPAFRRAIQQSRMPHATMAVMAGFKHPFAITRILSTEEIVATAQTRLRLQELARVIGYRGELLST